MSDDANTTILTSLGANPLPVIIPDEIIEDLPEDNGVDPDFEKARENLINIMTVTKAAIDNLTSLSSQSQSARAYEVLSNLINTYMIQQKDLLDLRKKRSEVRRDENTPVSGGNTPAVPNEMHNHLHIGSTADLQKLVESMKNGN